MKIVYSVVHVALSVITSLHAIQVLHVVSAACVVGCSISQSASCSEEPPTIRLSNIAFGGIHSPDVGAQVAS
jgi:hypothetical protein